MNATPRRAPHWWSPLAIPAGHGAMLRLGPLTLWLRRGSGEWLLTVGPAAIETVAGAGAVEPSDAPPGIDALRYVDRESGERAAFTPMLADRAVVVRPLHPVFVLPGQEALFYISTPAWIGVHAGDALLRQCPSERLADTWFGPDMMNGEICYAMPTHARSRLDELPLRPHRVVTPVHIVNRAQTQLPVEKLNLPVPHLSVYGRDDGSLWTESVRMVRSADSAMAAFDVEPGPPPYAPGAIRLAAPRMAHRASLVRAFSGLFGE